MKTGIQFKTGTLLTCILLFTGLAFAEDAAITKDGVLKKAKAVQAKFAIVRPL